MLRIGLIVLAVLALLVTLLWLGQRRLIYLPGGAVPPAPQVLPGARDVTLNTDDGLALGAWLVPPSGPADRPDRRITVLVTPGNGGDRTLRAPLARRLAQDGFGVLLIDYRGYGGNPGSPTEDGLAADARAAQRFLTDAGVPPSQQIYLGESLGAAVVTRLAVEHPPAGLVLRSPFVDLPAAGQGHYPLLPLRLLLWDRFPVAELVAQVDAPTVVVYGSADSIVPPEQSRAVAAAAPRLVRAVEVPGADHNDRVLLDGDPLLAAVRQVAP